MSGLLADLHLHLRHDSFLAFHHRADLVGGGALGAIHFGRAHAVGQDDAVGRFIHGRIADETGFSRQALEQNMRHRRPQIGLADPGPAHVVEPGEAEAGIGGELDRLVPHGAVAIDGHDGGVLLVEEVLEGQRQLAGLEDFVLGGLNDLRCAGNPAVGFRLGVGVADGVERLDDALEGDRLSRSELLLDIGGVLDGKPRGDVEDLRFAEMVQGPERPDRGHELPAIGGEHAVQHGALGLLLEGAEAGPFVARVRDCEQNGRPADAENLVQNGRDADVQVNHQDPVDALQLGLELPHFPRRGDQLVDDEVDIGQLLLGGLKSGPVRLDFGLQSNFGLGQRAFGLS